MATLLLVTSAAEANAGTTAGTIIPSSKLTAPKLKPTRRSKNLNDFIFFPFFILCLLLFILLVTAHLYHACACPRKTFLHFMLDKLSTDIECRDMLGFSY
jgi:hypothetical protein